MQAYLTETYYFNYNHPAFQRLIVSVKSEKVSLKDQAINWYLKVRDGWWYDPYQISFKKEALKASFIAGKKSGHCIDKAILYITGARALGIPARLHLAKVKNHIAVERLVEKFGTNELTPHGYAEVFLENKWVSATPAFNQELCHKIGVSPLEFDGEHDSIFQQYSENGEDFMEYLEDYGTFDDVPIDFIRKNMEENYPKLPQLLNEAGELKL
ncbi:MAG: transglutaminase family protein [Ekhidna sp.]